MAGWRWKGVLAPPRLRTIVLVTEGSEEARRLLMRFSRKSVLQSFAAMQLHATGPHAMVRLLRTCSAAALEPSKGGSRATTSSVVRAFLGSAPDWLMEEDPYDDFHCDWVGVGGHNYLFFPGIVEGATFSATSLGKALLVTEGGVASAAFRRFIALLRLGDAVARRAGITVRTPTVGAARQARVPDDKTLRKLCAAVTFTEAELARATGLPADELRAMISSPTVASPEDDSPGAIFRDSPMVESEPGTFVVIPFALSLATVRVVRASAADGLFCRKVMFELSRQITQRIIENLSECHSQVLSAPSYHGRGIWRVISSADIDKAVILMIVTDQNISSDLGEVIWRSAEVDYAVRLARKTIGSMYTSESPPNECFTIILVHSLDRQWMGGIPRDFPGHVVLTSADSFPVMISECDSIVGLMRFAEESRRIRANARVVALSPLDEFALYHSNGESYYLSDSKRPTVIMVQPGTAGPMRRKDIERRNRRSLLGFAAGTAFDVESRYPGTAAPVFVPRAMPRDVLAQVVSLSDLGPPIWVMARRSESGDEPQRIPQVVEALAYWIWQCTDLIARAVGGSRFPVTIRVRGDLQTKAAIEFRAASRSEFEVAVGDLFVAAHSVGDNSGERAMLTDLLGCLGEVSAAFGPEEIREEVDRVAPLGPKRMILVVPNAGRFFAAPPSARIPVWGTEASEQRVLDRVGAASKADGWAPPGARLSGADASSVLNRAVGSTMDDFERLIRTVRRDEILRMSYENQEALTSFRQLMRLQTAPKIACFENEKAYVDDLSERWSKEASAGTASRFILEYAAACDWAGTRPASESVYDELMAHARVISDYGSISDALYFGISSADVRVLDSERIGISRSDPFHASRDLFLLDVANEEVFRAREAFRGFWQGDDVGDQPAEPEANETVVRRAFVDEFEIELAELVEAGHVIQSICEQSGDVAESTIESAARIWHSEYGVAIGRASAVLRAMTATMREDFRRPPGGRIQDVMPWIYARRLSPLFRPLSFTDTNRSTVVFGQRFTRLAIEYQFMSVLTGRLRNVKSASMKRLQGEIGRRRGRQFTLAVASTLRSSGRFAAVRANVPLPPPLGDIDVVAADSRTRRIWAIECKNYSTGRTPREMASEIERFSHGSSGRLSHADRHARRIAWCRANVGVLLEQLGMASGKIWQIESCFVVDDELMAQHLVGSATRIVSMTKLQTRGLG